MQKTKIDWADYSWNPVTGCLHGCEYCYARKIANRFSPKMPDGNPAEYRTTHSIGNTNIPFPHGFDPTFYRNRLNEPAKIKKSQTIFVCSMADLFGEWVPDEWIREVFDACKAAPQHRYLFLTKNPDGYQGYQQQALGNMYFGATATTNDQLRKVRNSFAWLTKPMKRFVSIEPIQEPVILDTLYLYDWIIVGSETGNRKEKTIPNKSWIDDITDRCEMADVPIFMKESLRQIMGDDFRQEFPWEVKI